MLLCGLLRLSWRLTQDCVDRSFDQHRLGIDLIKIALVIIITVVVVQIILRPQVIGDLVIGPRIAEIRVIPLTHIIKLLGLARRGAAVVLLRKAGRAIAARIQCISAANAVLSVGTRVAHVALALGGGTGLVARLGRRMLVIAFALGVGFAGVGGNGASDCERQSARP